MVNTSTTNVGIEFNALLEDIKHAVRDRFSEYEVKLFELNSKKRQD